MFKILLTAATLSLTTLAVQAAPTAEIAAPTQTATLPITLAATPIVAETARLDEVAYYCEWAIVYDYFGNWVSVWQCY